MTRGKFNRKERKERKESAVSTFERSAAVSQTSRSSVDTAAADAPRTAALRQIPN
jgi:hypothetical protein